MGKCLNCGKEVAQTEGKRARLYCNDTCKKVFQRKAKLADNGTENITGHNRDTITGQANKSIFEYVDWKVLTPEQQAERWAKVKAGEHWACGHKLTGGYKMTDTERVSYQPADQLATNELNHVSLPGDIDYAGAALPLLTQQAQG